jgi:cytochrome c oxidase assembly protein subunit 23
MDPCAKQSKESLRCIEENPGNKGKCNAYFEAYRDCKKIWVGALHRKIVLQ